MPTVQDAPPASTGSKIPTPASVPTADQKIQEAMEAEPGSTLDSELQRLKRWLLLLEAWGQCQRQAGDTQTLAQGLCHLLVHSADYVHAAISITLPGGNSLQCQAGQSP